MITWPRALRGKKWISLGMMVFSAVAFLGAQAKVEIKTIDGIPHVLNPAKPLKGTVQLEVERMRTIDPYAQADVGMRMVRFSRDEAGNVILYDPNGAEAHRFGPDGKYLGLLTRKGQGPGEFSPMQGYWALFHGPEIWIYGGQKVAHFDATGKFLKDRILKHGFDAGVEAGRFLSRDSEATDEKTQIWRLRLVEFDMDGAENAVDLLRAENIEMIRNPSVQGAFGDEWGTPRFFFAADSSLKRVYCGLNTKYQISVRDYAGRTLLVIEKPYDYVKVSRADVEKLMSWALKNERSKWILSAYPDRLVAVKDVKPLPKGYLAVYRVAGVKKVEIDVFDPKGRYLYALIPPGDVKMDEAQFF
ncbi:MAG: hypothetical protein ACXVJK_01945, partial [Candidatus Aminicenantales bacterium]